MRPRTACGVVQHARRPVMVVLPAVDELVIAAPTGVATARD